MGGFVIARNAAHGAAGRRLGRAVGSWFAVIAAAALAAGAGGCKKKETPPPASNDALFQDIAAAQLRADEIFNGRDSMKIGRGKWNTPGSRAAYQAYRSSDTIRFIEEQDDRGEFGSSDNRYYFDSYERLFFYEDRGEEKEPRGSLPPMSRLIQRTLLFGDSGQAVWGRRLVDGAAGPVPDSQIVAIRDRARGLVAHAKGMVP